MTTTKSGVNKPPTAPQPVVTSTAPSQSQMSQQPAMKTHMRPALVSQATTETEPVAVYSPVAVNVGITMVRYITMTMSGRRMNAVFALV